MSSFAETYLPVLILSICPYPLGVKGSREEVAVSAGRFSAVKAPYRNGTVWVSDKVPALSLVKATLPDGELELVQSGTAGAQDLLRS